MANNTVPAFLFGDSITCHSKLSLHFLVEAIICHKVSHCICNIHHVLTHSDVFFKYSSISHYPPSDTGSTNAYTALQLFLLHKEFSHCTVANTSPTATYFHSTLQILSWRGTCTKHIFIQKRLSAHSWDLCIKK